MTTQTASAPTETFNELVNGAKVIKIDPSSCIPFISVRKLVPSGVLRLKHSLEDQANGSVLSGAVAGGVMPTVVRLCGSLFKHVIDYFREEFDLDEEEAKKRAEARKEWYGVVDGSHRLHDLLELQTEKPSVWGRFKWCVLLLNTKCSVSVLRAFARAQNVKQSDENYVETTQFDILSGLQEEARRLSVTFGGRKPSAKELAESFSGCGERTTSTLRKLASVALRLNEEVVSVIGDIVNFESPTEALTYYNSRGRGDLTAENIASRVDCRVYRKFITNCSLNLSSAFMKDKERNSDSARSNALYRCKEICRLNNFRPVNHQVVNEQFKKSLAALREALKFERLLQSTVWPRGMEQVQKNLLRNTIVDDEVEDNEGNGSEILPSLLMSLRRVYPDQAPVMEARYRASVFDVGSSMRDVGEQEGYTNQLEANMVLTQETGTRTRGVEADGEGDQGQGTLDTGREPDTAPYQKSPEGAEALLEMGIVTFRMDWQSYNKIFDATPESLFDLVLTEPPFALPGRKGSSGLEDRLDEKAKDEFVCFCKRVLCPGGYVIIFTPSKWQRDWIRVLKGNDFECADYPLVIAQDTKGMQRTNRILFPQNVCEFAVMASAPGRNPRAFTANFEEPYTLVNCDYKRKFAAISGVEVVKTKLKHEDSRALVRSEEKNSSMLAEVIVTFSPNGGRVLDPFAGTMSAGIACLETGRKCVLVEKDSVCYDLAFRRLCSLSDFYGRDSIQSLDPEERLKKCPDRQPDWSLSEERSHISDSEHSKQDSAAGPSTSAQRRVSFAPPSLQEGAEVLLSQGKHVTLLIEGQMVGTAEVQADPEDSRKGYRKVLHGVALSNFERQGEKLVVVWQVQIQEEWADYKYPYNYGGIEGPVATLGEMEHGFHAWDLNSMMGSVGE